MCVCVCMFMSGAYCKWGWGGGCIELWIKRLVIKLQLKKETHTRKQMITSY